MNNYVPMTDDEWQSISAKYQGDDDSEYPWEAYIEQAVLSRIAEQGLVIVPVAATERDCKDCEGLLEDITELNKALNPEAYGIVDAERVALIRQLDEHLAHGEIVGIFDTLLSIRAYLQGGA